MKCEVVVLKKVLICVYSITHYNILQLSFSAFCMNMYVSVYGVKILEHF